MSERIAKLLHDAYERHAQTNGWETQAASRKHWDEVPEANRNTMIAMVDEILPGLLEEAFYNGFARGAFAEGLVMNCEPKRFNDWYREEYGGDHEDNE